MDFEEHTAFLSGAPSVRRLALPNYDCQLGILGGYDVISGAPAGAWAEPAPADQIRRMLGEDWRFYEAEAEQLARAAPVRAPAGAPFLDRPATGLPLVSCVMPTANRRPYVAQAIRYFQRQDYPNKELVILDDGEDTCPILRRATRASATIASRASALSTTQPVRRGQPRQSHPPLGR